VSLFLIAPQPRTIAIINPTQIFQTVLEDAHHQDSFPEAAAAYILSADTPNKVLVIPLRCLNQGCCMVAG